MVVRVLFYFLISFISYQSLVFPHETFLPAERTASDVFLEFMTDNIDYVDEKDINYINSNWIDDLERDVQEWSVQDASEFLSFLQNLDIRTRIILKLFQATGYLKILKASTQFEASETQRHEKSGSHVILDFVDRKIGIDRIERVMGEGWLDKADDIFSSWSVVEAERLLNILKFQGVGNILRILQITTNYLSILKDNENTSSRRVVISSKKGPTKAFAFQELQEQKVFSGKILQAKKRGLLVEPQMPIKTSSISQSQDKDAIVLESPKGVLTNKTDEEVIVESQVQQAETQVTDSESIISHITGSEVFIQYVKDYFKEEFEQNQPSGQILDKYVTGLQYTDAGLLEYQTNGQTLDEYVTAQMHPLRLSSSEPPSPWQERISHYARHWTGIEAHAFLNFLQKDIGVAPVYMVKALQMVSFFGTTYRPFRERVNVYREYLADDEIKEIIEKKGLALFYRGQPENIRTLIEFLIKYLGEDRFEELVMSNSSTLKAASSEGTINQFEAKIRYLERYLGRGDPLKGEKKLKNILRNGGFFRVC